MVPSFEFLKRFLVLGYSSCGGNAAFVRVLCPVRCCGFLVAMTDGMCKKCLYIALTDGTCREYVCTAVALGMCRKLYLWAYGHVGRLYFAIRGI
uniref:Uncharacterized protein n=1 Tax=Anguilla anguilla TaxID=7936 RepID=A0A0E9WQU8_ANGAN